MVRNMRLEALLANKQVDFLRVQYSLVFESLNNAQKWFHDKVSGELIPLRTFLSDLV